MIINQGQGLDDKLLSCRDVIVPDPAGNAPTGSITGLSSRVGGFEVTGSASDPNSGSPVTVDLQLDGVTVRSVTAGPRVPFAVHVQGVVGGAQLLCLRVRNLGSGADTNVDCRDLNVPWSSPRGAVEGLRRVGDELQLWGWAVDDETVDPTFEMVIVNGRWTIVWAKRPKPGWESAFPRLGPNRGLQARIPVWGGAQGFCVVARNVGADRTPSSRVAW